MIISNETLVLDEAKETKGSWSQDWDGYVLPAIDEMSFECKRTFCMRPSQNIYAYQNWRLEALDRTKERLRWKNL